METRSKIFFLATGLAASVGTAFLFVGHNAPAKSPTALTDQGMIAVIDRQSGQLRAPTADEAALYVSPQQTATASAPVIRRADGSASMRLDDSYTIYSSVTRKEDGTWQRRCGLDHDHSAHAPVATAVAAAKAVR